MSATDDGGVAMQNVLDVLLMDLSVLLSTEVNGAPLESPIFVLILKTICVQFIDLANKADDMGGVIGKKLFVLDAVKVLIIPMYQLIRRQERLK